MKDRRLRLNIDSVDYGRRFALAFALLMFVFERVFEFDIELLIEFVFMFETVAIGVAIGVGLAMLVFIRFALLAELFDVASPQAAPSAAIASIAVIASFFIIGD